MLRRTSVSSHWSDVPGHWPSVRSANPVSAHTGAMPRDAGPVYAPQTQCQLTLERCPGTLAQRTLRKPSVSSHWSNAPGRWPSVRSANPVSAHTGAMSRDIGSAYAPQTQRQLTLEQCPGTLAQCALRKPSVSSHWSNVPVHWPSVRSAKPASAHTGAMSRGTGSAYAPQTQCPLTLERVPGQVPSLPARRRSQPHGAQHLDIGKLNGDA